MKTKVSTNKEQSKKLIKLGIDKNTADCYLDYLLTKPIPSWSLTALIGLMPTQFSSMGTIYSLDIHPRDGKWFITYKCNNEEFVGTYSDSIFDAAFDMICWLLKNKKI